MRALTKGFLEVYLEREGGSLDLSIDLKPTQKKINGITINTASVEIKLEDFIVNKDKMHVWQNGGNFMLKLASKNIFERIVTRFIKKSIIKEIEKIEKLANELVSKTFEVDMIDTTLLLNIDNMPTLNRYGIIMLAMYPVFLI